MSYKYLFAIVCILCALFPAVLGATASLSWDNQTGYCITAMDSNAQGTLLIVGFGNGTIMGFDPLTDVGNATRLWSVPTNVTAPNNWTIKKIVADSNGDVAWISRANESGFISFAGATSGFTHGTGRNNSDVGISVDGSTYAITEKALTPNANNSKIIIYHSDGTIHAQNTTFQFANWTKLAYDPNGQWIATANQSDPNLYFWTIIQYDGWEQFNPTHTSYTTKNNSILFIDHFPFRQNITLSSNATTQGIRFVNNLTNTSISAPIVRLNDTTYQYNQPITGNSFLWSLPGILPNASNFTNVNNSVLLNLSLVSTDTYYVVFRPGMNATYTMYYGNTSYNGSVYNQSWTNNGTRITQYITSSQQWVAPSAGAGVSAVNVTMYGGGGGGALGTATFFKGQGGNSSTSASYNILVTPGASYSVTIGAGGLGAIYNPFSAQTAGGTTTFNNGTAFSVAGASAGSGANATGEGGNGNTSIPGYPTASNGLQGVKSTAAGCTGYVNTDGGPGGSGFGSGGGGGGETSNKGCPSEHVGSGGNGASGVVQISYYVNDVPVYYYGAAPTTTLATYQVRLSDNSLNLTGIKQYVGSIVGLGIPSNGGMVSVQTDTILYQQYITSGNYGNTYNATLSSGAPALLAGVAHDIKTSNSGSATIEGRGSYGLIYDSGAVLKAQSLTGGTINSVDSAMSSGLFGSFGGSEGKLYMVSREGTTSWYTYYTGSAGSPINAIINSWDGAYVGVGRENGLLEFYNTSVLIGVVPAPTSGVGSNSDVQLRVYKDSAPYAIQNVTIYTSATPTNWVPLATSYTDGNGRMTYTTTIGQYYRFVVNNGEGEAIWQSNSGSTIVQIRILSGITPYEWSTMYNQNSHNVTTTYTDSVPSDVTITITDTKTNQVVLTKTYTSTTGFDNEYHDQLENGTYQVNVKITRLGQTTKDSRSVTSGGLYEIPIPIEEWMKWAISTLTLMLIAGLFSYANQKRGAFVVVIIAAVFIIFGWLPVSLTTIAMLAGMLAVASLFGSRVQ